MLFSVHVEQLLLYPHVWVRLASAELFGLMLAAWTPQELAARVGKPTTSTPLYLQDHTMEKVRPTSHMQRGKLGFFFSGPGGSEP